MKARLGLFGGPSVPAPVVGTPEQLATMADIAARSVTSLRDTVLPLRPGQNVLVTGWGVSTTQNLTNGLIARGLSTTRFYTGSPTAAVIAQAVAAAQIADVTVVTTYNAWGDLNQQNLVAALLATGKPIVVASVGGPYDIAYFPQATTYLAAYDYQPVSVTALADVLAGRTRATGRLPVTIRSADGGAVLFPYGSPRPGGPAGA
jgi:beta-N-acetylhexosaminidase